MIGVYPRDLETNWRAFLGHEARHEERPHKGPHMRQARTTDVSALQLGEENIGETIWFSIATPAGSAGSHACRPTRHSCAVATAERRDAESW